MEDTEAQQAAPPVAGGVKIPVDVPKRARELLRSPPKTFAKPRKRSGTTGASEAIDVKPLMKPSLIPKSAKRSETSDWQKKAWDFFDQVFEEVDRLIQKVEGEATAQKAHDMLKQAWIPRGSREKMTPDKFLEKTELVMTLLQRIPQPAILQPPHP